MSGHGDRSVKGAVLRSVVFATVTVLFVTSTVVLALLYRYFGAIQENWLKEELHLAAVSVGVDGADFFSRYEQASEGTGSSPGRPDGGDRRFTWIAADGTVLCDTLVDAAGMESHADREEVREALETGEGSSVRYSSTLLEKTVYFAVRLADGSVLRVSADQATLGTVAMSLAGPFLAILAAAVVASVFLAERLSKHVASPLASLDLDRPLENDVYDELSPLLRRLDEQHARIESQMGELQRRADEFDQITGSMREGLVLLDDSLAVLAVNGAAKSLFGVDDSCVGRSFASVDRTYEIGRALREAMACGSGEAGVSRGGREYRLNVSRIESGGRVLGCVLLAFDVTDRANAERIRREFTANVSHELKTPLQGIVGSADLIAAGVVQPDDVPRFMGHIKDEAIRLVSLINDIIDLAQLDEGAPMPAEDVDLASVARDVCADLSDAAARRGIEVSLDLGGAAGGDPADDGPAGGGPAGGDPAGGAPEPVTVHGVPRLLYEIAYNLCDNAIKYNVPNGKVRVSVTVEDGVGTNAPGGAGGSGSAAGGANAGGGYAVLTVSDTGIGIPPEAQQRVFERFFRVDKSRSKTSGGTGLGLSIVKHAVEYHHATVRLDSKPGEGTTIVVRFPRDGAAR